MKKLLNNLLIFILIFTANNTYSVPLPPSEKYDITGTISEINWYPEKFIKGIPGMSGSAGKNRLMPSHYIIKLINYEGIKSDDAIRINQYIKRDSLNSTENKKPTFILLKLNSKNKYYLKKGMKIKVTGYEIRGDEGGTYTYYEKIEILKLDKLD